MAAKSVSYSFFQAISSAAGGSKIKAGADQSGSFTWSEVSPTNDADSAQFVPGELISNGPTTYTYVGTYNGGIIVRTGSTYFYAGSTGLSTNGNINTPYSSITGATGTSPVCFLAGTLILTPDGLRAIETLVVGDLVTTASGSKPVKFLAHSTRSLNTLRALGKMPIRIRAGALGSHGPELDIYLSPSHAIALDGHLVEAGALLNGSTIDQLDAFDAEEITYFNIECEQHELIWANGMQSESYFASYRSNGFSRDSWDNFADYTALYGESATMQELDLPRIPFARQLPASVRLLLQRNEAPLKAGLSL